MLHRAADGIEQGSTACRFVILRGERRNGADVTAIMDDLAFLIEHHSGDKDGKAFRLLLFEQGIEAADGVRFEAIHGAAAVEDEYEFGTVFHGVLLKC
ncbi:MAG: hypothetical protein IKJ34_00380 [Mailhella sp.]|nr:hypothetical protein [Mailhella sp.]